MLYVPPVRHCQSCGQTDVVRLAHTCSQLAIEGFCRHCGQSLGTCQPDPEPAARNFWERDDYPTHARLGHAPACACRHCKPRTPATEAEADPAGVDPFGPRN